MNIHEETLKIARNLIEKDPSLTDWVVSKFPELKDEDERIRKELIDFVKSRLAGFPQCEKFIYWLKKQGKQKSVDKSAKWSERDIHIITNIYDFVAENTLDINRRPCAYECLDWLKSLKYRTQSVQDWSEEDSYMLGQAIKCVNNSGKLDVSTKEIEYWLKSIRPQKWKPTEEQLRELENVFSPDTDSWNEDVLRELYKQLKQL